MIAKYLLVSIAALALAGCNQILGIDDPVAAIDAAPAACEADELTCGGACVEVATSRDHCGRCDHACGGGVCSDGVCLSFKVGRFPGAAELTATADAVYVSHAGAVSSCPMPGGCGDAEPTTIATGVAGTHELAVAGGHVYFSTDSAESGHQLCQCPIAGCGDAPLVLASGPTEALDLRSTATTLHWRRDGIALSSCAVADCMASLRDYSETFTEPAYSLALDGGTLYVGTGVGLFACPADIGCAEAAAAMPDTTSIEAKFRVHADVAYWFAGGKPAMQIYRCPLATHCLAETTEFAHDSSGVTRLEADATGVYWLTGSKDEPGLRHCPLAGCASDGRGADLVPPRSFRVPPRTFALGPGFVYWIEGDDVLAVARP